MKETIINPVIKDQVTFMQTAAASQGRITTLQVSLMPGGGTPMHYHKNFTETFVVIEGILTLKLNSSTIHLFPGEKYTVEIGQVHGFANGSSEPVVFTTVVSPGCEGFEFALRILYGLAADGLTDEKGLPKSLLALAVVSKISDMRPAGAGALMIPFFGLLNLIALLNGYKKELLRRYCS